MEIIPQRKSWIIFVECDVKWSEVLKAFPLGTFKRSEALDTVGINTTRTTNVLVTRRHVIS
jgi:hypothetical protein